MVTPTPVEILTIEEFVRLYRTEGPFEWIDGEIVTLSPAVSRHSELANNLAFHINTYTIPKKLGKALVETAFVLPDADRSDWVRGSRVPDVMFYTEPRLAEYKNQTPKWADLPFMIVPELAVEIVSANDRYTDVMEKVDHYLNDGVTNVWVIDPQRHTLTLYTQDSNQQTTFGENDTVSADGIIAGYSFALAEFFAS